MSHEEQETLVAKVREMREAQTRYFRSRRRDDLHKAQRLEREVDVLLGHLANHRLL